jgi:hypothetical protein
VSLQGADKLRARLNAIGKTEQVTRDISEHGVREAGLLAHHRTGNMRRTIRTGNVSAFQAEIRAGGRDKVGYAAAEELGRRAVTIRPRNKKVLAWGGPRTLGGRLRVSGGVTARAEHFAKVVHQPARLPHPFLRPGLQKAAAMYGVKRIVSLWNGAA